MAKVKLTGAQRRAMLEAAKTGEARWGMLTHKEKKEAKEFEEHRKKLAERRAALEKEKKELSEAQQEVIKDQKVPISRAKKRTIWYIVFFLVILVGAYLYLRFGMGIDVIAWISGLIKA